MYAAMRVPSLTSAAEIEAHVRAAHAESILKGFEKPFIATMYFLGTKFVPMLFEEALMPLFTA